MKSRIKSCLKQLESFGCDSFLVSCPVNIEYLTGLSQQDGYLLIGLKDRPTYFTSFLYKKAAEKAKFLKVVTSSISGSGGKNNIFALIAEEIKGLNYKKIGFEAKKLSFLEYKTLAAFFQPQDRRFIGLGDSIEKLRMVKDKQEIELIKKSVEVSQEAFRFVSQIFDPEMSEKTLAIEVEKFLRLRADNQIAFPPIVASGKNTVFPHHCPQDSKIGRNFFLIDLGSRYYGYCADLTRVFFESKMPLLFKRIYETLKKAQDLALKKVKDGTEAGEVDKAAREFIEKKGWGKYFGHGLGHGIGLSVHEPPFLRPQDSQILKQGMVLTLEPAIYLESKFGLRIEDMVLVTQGKGEILSGDIHR